MFKASNLFIFVLILFASVGSSAYDPPTEQDLAKTPPTFKVLAQVQKQREKLFPVHLAGRESTAGSKLKEAVKYWKSNKTGHDAVVALQDAIKRNESGKSKVFSVIGRGDFDALKARLLKLDGYFGALDKVLDAFQVSQELPDFSVYSEYEKAPEKPEAFFKLWVKNLDAASLKYAEGATALNDAFIDLEGKGWLNESDISTVSKYVKTLNEIAASIVEASVQSKAYVDFEQKCDGLRAHFHGRDAGTVIITGQINSGVSFHDWLDDYLEYAPAYPSEKLKPQTLEAFYKKSLDTLNKITIANMDDVQILKHVDSAYRTVFLRLQGEGGAGGDYRNLVQQRQLAKNGMSSILEAYSALARIIGCKESASECATPETKGLIAKVEALMSWVEANPLEAETLASEISHALSILQSNGGSVASDAIGFLKNAQARRLSGDFIKSAVFGDYDPLVDPKQTLFPELIALTHFSGSLPYMASIPKSLFNQNLASTLTNAGAYAASLVVGGPVPVAILATIKVLMGLGQVKAEKITASLLSARADSNALMTGILAIGSGSGLKSGLQKAAAIYLAKHGTRLFGNGWTNLREGRLDWKKEACKVSVAVASGLYAWCKEGVASGVTTAAVIYCSNECTLWRYDGTTLPQRAQSTIDTIAENMGLDPNIIVTDSQKSGTANEYDQMLSKLSKNDSTPKKDLEKALEALFSGRPFLFGGFGFLTSLATR